MRSISRSFEASSAMVLRTCLGVGRGTEPPWHPLLTSPLPLLISKQHECPTIGADAGEKRVGCCHSAVVDELNTLFNTCCKRKLTSKHGTQFAYVLKRPTRFSARCTSSTAPFSAAAVELSPSCRHRHNKTSAAAMPWQDGQKDSSIMYSGARCGLVMVYGFAQCPAYLQRVAVLAAARV